MGDPGKSGCAITPNSKILGTVESKFLWGTQESQVVQSHNIPKSYKFFANVHNVTTSMQYLY